MNAIFETILPAGALPTQVLQFLPTEKVRVRAFVDEVHLIAVREEPKGNCPFLGLYSDGKLTVDGYLERKREEKELEA